MLKKRAWYRPAWVSAATTQSTKSQLRSWLWRARERKSTFGHLLMLPQTHLPKLYNGTPKCTYTKICRYFYILKIFCFSKTIQKVGLEEIEKYQKGQKPYQNLYLATNPEKVVKNSWSTERILLTKYLIFWANKKVRSCRKFDKNAANVKSKAEYFKVSNRNDKV